MQHLTTLLENLKNNLEDEKLIKKDSMTVNRPSHRT